MPPAAWKRKSKSPANIRHSPFGFRHFLPPMSQLEFDTYLSLLCRLLRIAPQQREQVAEEFRAHMEDRLEELLARGMERETAIKLALEEFGDAAGLAAQIASISQGRRKR